VVVVPNQNLKPEYAWSADFSLTGNIGKLIHSEVTVYYTILTNAMVRDAFTFGGEDSIIYREELSKVEAITNSGSAKVYGMNFSVLANLTRHFSLKSVLNLSDGYEEDGDPLRHIAPLFGSTHLAYTKGKFDSDLYALYNGSKRFEKMAPSEIEKPYLYATDRNGNPWSPGWFTLNLKLSYQIRNRFKFTTGIENILDLRYRPYSSGIVSPGRNFLISLKIDL
jgi:hemoglobin/transferrin/lactoferrin receptor protein